MEPHVAAWEPTRAEIEQIMVELRPLIRRFADRDRQVLGAAAEPARAPR